MVRGVFVAMVVTGFLFLQGVAQTAPPKPDLHAGGPEPSTIPNHETTQVKLPGLHLTGTTVTVSGPVCTLKSYKVVSDNEILMTIEAHRETAEKEDGCFFDVHQGAYKTGGYVVVDLTEAEQSEKHKRENEASKAKAETYMAGLGKQWTLRYADGSSETFNSRPNENDLPDFVSASGVVAKIMTSQDQAKTKVMVMTEGCMRQGTLVGNEVKDGTSMGDCKPGGAWTGQKR
jgi:hypothetical protein